MRAIFVGLAIFFIAIFSAMYYANRFINDKEMDERTQSCALDSIGGAELQAAVYSAKMGQSLVFRGWAADTTVGRVPDSIDIVLENGDDVRLGIGSGKPTLPRPDVVTMYKSDGVLKSGFSINAAVTVPKAGDWDVHLVEHFSISTIVCFSNKVLRVSN